MFLFASLISPDHDIKKFMIPLFMTDFVLILEVTNNFSLPRQFPDESASIWSGHLCHLDVKSSLTIPFSTKFVYCCYKINYKTVNHHFIRFIF